ncbi:hypothetical protein D3C73_278490 [compost metagenome]
MFKMDGFDELERQMKKMQKAAKDLEEESEVSFEILFNETFMAKYTSRRSFDDFLTYGGFIVNSQEGFEAIPDDEFDAYVKKETKFDSWEEMQETAMGEYVAKQLGF